MAKPINYIEHAADVISCAAHMIDEKRAFALVTAIDIKGGSARELGTLALIADDGEMFGYLSNGCIDRDIQMQGLSVLEEGEPRIVKYGAGSPFLDLTLPCGGSLSLLIDPNPDPSQLLRAHAALSQRQPASLEFVVPRTAPLKFVYAPKPRLALAGRGSIFRSMAECGHASGFDLQLFSPEEADLQHVEVFAPWSSQHLKTPQDVPELELDHYSSFLTLFHDHDWEPALLRKALQTPARYIGCLGSQKTHAQRCATLLAADVPPAEIDRIKGPIGLVPSLRQAPFIAISAMAHVIESFPRFIEQHGLDE